DSARLGVSTLAVGAYRLRRIVAQARPDVVLAHGGWPAQVVALGIPKAGPARVWQRILEFPITLWRPTRRWWWAMIAKRFDAAVALTSPLKTELRRLGFRRRVWIIPNARRPGRFVTIDRPAAGEWLRETIGVDEDTHVIGFVGHLIEQKQPLHAIAVLR